MKKLQNYHQEITQWLKFRNRKDKLVGLGVILIPGAGILFGSYILYKAIKKDINEGKNKETP